MGYSYTRPIGQLYYFSTRAYLRTYIRRYVRMYTQQSLTVLHCWLRGVHYRSYVWTCNVYPCIYRHMQFTMYTCTATVQTVLVRAHYNTVLSGTWLQSECHASMNEAFTHQQGMNTFLGCWLPWLRKVPTWLLCSTSQML